MLRPVNQYTPELFQELCFTRREISSPSIQKFAKIYLSNICDKPFSNMHRTIIWFLNKAIRDRRARIAIAAPRGHAKSTVVGLVYVLWCLLYDKEKLILLVSNTEDQAVKYLRDIREQIESNPLICADFPEICQVRKKKPWSKRQIQLPTGAMVFAYGVNQQIRGIKKNKYRPSLIIADDMENLEQAESEEQRDKLREWFYRTLLNAGDSRTNVVVVGTILHQDSILAELTNSQHSPGWTSMKYRAVRQFATDVSIWEKWTNIYCEQEQYDGLTGPKAAEEFFRKNQQQMLEGTKVLWPQKESYYELMVLRQELGYRNFQSEKQNEPIDPKRCIFKKENFHFWDDEFRDTQHLIEAIGKYGYFYGACDPSMGRTVKGDYTAIIILLKDIRTKILYIIAADLLHCTPDETIQRIVKYAGIYRLSRFAVESNNFQQLMVDDLERRLLADGHKIYIKSLQHSSQKISRISSLELYVSQGLLRFSRKHQGLLLQLTQFPLAKNDDGPDALEMAVEIARKLPTRLGVGKPSEAFRRMGYTH